MCGDGHQRADQKLQREDGGDRAAGVRRSSGRQPAQAEETEHGEALDPQHKTLCRYIYIFLTYRSASAPKAKRDHLVDEVPIIMNEVHGVALLLFLDGNVADVPCLSLALLAFTSQVLSSLQRSGGMYHCALPVQ